MLNDFSAYPGSLFDALNNKQCFLDMSGKDGKIIENDLECESSVKHHLKFVLITSL